MSVPSTDEALEEPAAADGAPCVGAAASVLDATAPEPRRLVRPSQLQIADRCGLAPRLSVLHPQSSLEAERGSALHAEVAAWLNEGVRPTRPEVFALIEHLGSALRAGAYRGEVPIELRDPENDDVITRGTADAVAMGMDLTVVLDFKSGAEEHVAPVDGNLQLHAYALGAALEAGSRAYRTGLVFLREGAPIVRVSRSYAPADWWEILERIKAATSRAPIPTVGPHCHGCFQRRHCPAWILPAHDGPSALEPFTRAAGVTLENASEALRVVQAMREALTIAEAQLKDFARSAGGIVDGERVWGPTTSVRRTADIAALERDGLGAYVRSGAPYETFRWRRV